MGVKWLRLVNILSSVAQDL